VLNRTRAVYTNETPAGAFRGFGVPQAAIAHECLMDDLALQLKLDRWAIRRINALDQDDVTYSGHRLASSAGLPQCLHARHRLKHGQVIAGRRERARGPGAAIEAPDCAGPLQMICRVNAYAKACG
jgi:CO/xanthine dehydrogenase Mo-binding subunit